MPPDGTWTRTLACCHGLGVGRAARPFVRRSPWAPRTRVVMCGNRAPCTAPGNVSPLTAATTLGTGTGDASAVPAMVAATGMVTPSAAASVTDTHDVRTADRTPCNMTGASALLAVTLRVVP